jgi:hypothetical protein
LRRCLSPCRRGNAGVTGQRAGSHALRAASLGEPSWPRVRSHRLGRGMRSAPARSHLALARRERADATDAQVVAREQQRQSAQRRIEVVRGPVYVCGGIRNSGSDDSRERDCRLNDGLASSVASAQQIEPVTSSAPCARLTSAAICYNSSNRQPSLESSRTWSLAARGTMLTGQGIHQVGALATMRARSAEQRAQWSGGTQRRCHARGRRDAT